MLVGKPTHASFMHQALAHQPHLIFAQQESHEIDAPSLGVYSSHDLSLSTSHDSIMRQAAVHNSLMLFAELTCRTFYAPSLAAHICHDSLLSRNNNSCMRTAVVHKSVMCFCLAEIVISLFTTLWRMHLTWSLHNFFDICMHQALAHQALMSFVQEQS